MKKLLFAGGAIVGFLFATACAEASSKLTTRQMVTSSSAPAAVPGAGAAGSGDAVARADHSHACTAASASAAGCVTAGAQTFGGEKTFADGVTLGQDAGVVFGDGTRQATAPEQRFVELARRQIKFDLNSVTSTTWNASITGTLSIATYGTPTQSMVGGKPGLNYADSVTTNNAPHGVAVTTGVARWAWDPTLAVTVETPPDLSTTRGLIGLTTGTLAGISLDGTYPAGTPGFALLGWETDVSANWLCCSGAGPVGEYGCSDTGQPISTSTAYSLKVDFTSSSVRCTVNGASTNRTATIPADTNAVQISIQHLNTVAGAAAQPFRMSRFALETL